MRKVFCDGCGEELKDESPRGFIYPPGTIFATLRLFDGTSFEWCKGCTVVARIAIQAKHAG